MRHTYRYFIPLYTETVDRYWIVRDDLYWNSLFDKRLLSDKEKDNLCLLKPLKRKDYPILEVWLSYVKDGTIRETTEEELALLL